MIAVICNAIIVGSPLVLRDSVGGDNGLRGEREIRLVAQGRESGWRGGALALACVVNTLKGEKRQL